MSELSINDLFPEILVRVFRFLDVVNLKNATLTCKLWNNFIESECRWKLNLGYGKIGTFYCKHSSELMIKFALTTNRKFGTIAIMGSQLSDNEQIRQILQRHGSNVVKLSLRECHVESLNEFAGFLNYTPNLKHIVIDRNRIDLPDASDVPLECNLSDLKRLKNLEITRTDQRIIKCFQNAKLRSITIEAAEFATQHSEMTDFLLSQEMLTSLTDNTCVSSGSILTEMGKLNVATPFRLTHLAVARYERGISLLHDDDKNLLKFVQSHAKHLRELKLGFGIPSTVYECVFSSMDKLISLTLVNSQLPRDDKFYDRLKENRSVRTIKLLSSFYNGDGHNQLFGILLKKLPSIRSLVLHDADNNSGKTLVIAQNVSKLESFSINAFDKRTVDGVKFPNLKTLHIQYLNKKKINWNEFTKAHPLLTDLAINIIRDKKLLTSDDIDEITTNVDLQHVRLGHGFVADDRFFEIIRTKCTNLRVLDLHESCIPHGLNDNVGSNVRYRLRFGFKNAQPLISFSF